MWTKICIRVPYEVPSNSSVRGMVATGTWERDMGSQKKIVKKTPFSAPKLVILTNFLIFPGKTPVGISSYNRCRKPYAKFEANRMGRFRDRPHSALTALR